MLEEEEHFPFNELMEIHVLNLERLPEGEDGKLADWLRFLKAEKEEEFKMVAQHGMTSKDIAAVTHLSEPEVGDILKAGNV
jgi:DNA-directed RNA polymerase specialized sigma24 family protein